MLYKQNFQCDSQWQEYCDTLVLLKPRRSVVANFVPGNFGLFRWYPWQPLAETSGSAKPRLKNTALHSLESGCSACLDSWCCLFILNHRKFNKCLFSLQLVTMKNNQMRKSSCTFGSAPLMYISKWLVIKCQIILKHQKGDKVTQRIEQVKDV